MNMEPALSFPLIEQGSSNSLLQAPTLSLPTGSEFSLLLKKRLSPHSLRVIATIVLLMHKVHKLLMNKTLLY